MARDFKKEADWRKRKYKRFVLDLEQEQAKAFIEQLNKDNLKFAEWAKGNIEKYLKNN